MWRQSLRFQRCLMPAMGWYEWNERQQVRSRSGRLVKQPYYHHAVGDEVMAIAGLWSTWTGPEGQDVVSCALLTKEAAPSISYVHHRMPVILHPEQFTLWLNPETKADQVLEAVALCREDFVAYPVSTEVGNTKNDYAELLEPVEVEP
ncbi:putative SOS response-associated peptidase YedK [compost metagenome]